MIELWRAWKGGSKHSDVAFSAEAEGWEQVGLVARFKGISLLTGMED